MTNLKNITLNNGVEVPLLATGSWAPPTPEDQAGVTGWLLTALKNGFRHIDTAQSYGTEKAVGEAVKQSGIPREEIFITTKLPWNHHTRVRESLETSLANLGTGYIDLYLIHWPQSMPYDGKDEPMGIDVDYEGVDQTIRFNDTWAEMEKLLDTGKVRAIGVSNFSVKTLEELLQTAKIIPAVNQVELHPYLAQNDLMAYCRKKGIVVASYSSSGYIVRDDPLIVSLAEKYKMSPTQVIFAWHRSRGNILICKSTNNARQKEILAIPDMSEEDLAKIWSLDKGMRIAIGANKETGRVLGWTLEKMGWVNYRQGV